MHSRRPQRISAGRLNEKRQALHTELDKQTPDVATAKALQKEISDLQAQFDQKRLTHILEMKKIDPNFDGRQRHGAGSFSPRTGQLRNCGIETTALPGKRSKKRSTRLRRPWVGERRIYYGRA